MIIYKYLEYKYGMELLQGGLLHLSGMDLHNDPFEALPASKYIPPIQTIRLFREALQTREGRSLLKSWGISDNLLDTITKGSLTGSIITMNPMLLVASAGLWFWNKRRKAPLPLKKVGRTRNLNDIICSCPNIGRKLQPCE